jgi:hypothetical protein
MANNLDSITASSLSAQLVQSLIDSTNSLNSIVASYNLQFLSNYNYIDNNLQTFDNSFKILDNNVNKLQNVFSPEYGSFLQNNILYLENMFSNMYTLIENNNYNVSNFSNVYIDIFDSTLTPVVGQVGISITNYVQLYNLFNISIDTANLPNDIYYLKIYYNNDLDNYLLSNPINYLQNSNKLLERYQFSNNLGISKNLVNYKIYLLNMQGDILNSKYIVNSTISETIIDFQTFSLFENISNPDLTQYQFFLKEELFDEIWMELHIEDYTANDIGNVILGNAQRDLSTGVASFFNADGSILSQHVSQRYGKSETRKKIS